MKVIKKYTAIQIGTETVNDTVKVCLEYGNIEGPHYSREYPEQEFDTEEEAVEYAYKHGKYNTWMIVPIIQFNNFNHQ